ncbi:response regulator [Variovorax sp. J22R115]|uniref:response regulator n=1 Tax=Variovorax sp. J22R115 TaxID=3053509 RepID=UPI002576AD0C|nr:response regulator [Variovorax sp. J22R115]MDM0053556.1 response regulator [Variovorax sp. J22R115]
MSTFSQATVAVVDDDLAVLESVSELLESAGYAALTFSSGSALLEGDALHRVDCVISDICMAGIDGWQVMALAHQQRPQLPVILLTAHDRAERMTRDMPLAGDVHALFRKPFSAQDLLSAIADAVSPRA